MLTLYEWPLSAKVSILCLAVLISKMFFGFRVGHDATQQGGHTGPYTMIALYNRNF